MTYPNGAKISYTYDREREGEYMIVYAKYEEKDEICTSIYIPDIPGLDIVRKQEEFFKWLFDKNNHHKYWRIVDGQKKVLRI